MTDDCRKQQPRPTFKIPPAATQVGITPDGRPVIVFRNGPFKGRTYAMKAGGGLERASRQ